MVYELPSMSPELRVARIHFNDLRYIDHLVLESFLGCYHRPPTSGITLREPSRATWID
jgi:hypothetical protein